MERKVVRISAAIANTRGLHARASAKFVETVAPVSRAKSP